MVLFEQKNPGSKSYLYLGSIITFTFWFYSSKCVVIATVTPA